MFFHEILGPGGVIYIFGRASFSPRGVTGGVPERQKKRSTAKCFPTASRCDGASFFASLPNTHTNTHHRQVPMGKLKVHVAVRTWGLPAMLDTLTVDVEDGVSEGSFKVRMVMMLLLVGVMRATIVWRGWALPTQDEMLGMFSC